MLGWLGKIMNLAAFVKECAVVRDDVKILIREMDRGLELLRQASLSIPGQAQSQLEPRPNDSTDECLVFMR